jgi:hypothetical protein
VERQSNSDSPSLTQKQQLVQRVVNSHAFCRTPALRNFLLCIVAHALSGQLGKLKKRAIGVEALDRNPGYGSRTDNVVRVRARELRNRLEACFSAEGGRVPMVIAIPGGGYPKAVYCGQQ